MTRSPRKLFAAAAVAIVSVHAAALGLTVLPAMSFGRRHPGLLDALPAARAVLVVTGALLAAAGVVILLRRRARAQALLGATVCGALLAAGSLYGCGETVEVARRPVITRPAGERQVFSHATFDRVLGRFVSERGMVDYRGLAADRADLDDYAGQLASASPRSHPDLFPTDADRMAYWINAYNALILRAVIDHYPIDSVTDIMVAHGVFSRVHFPVGGQRLSLDDLEKGILLEEFDDPRVHFALTCASMSCPRLDRTAFSGDGLSARLDAEGQDFLRSPDGTQVDGDSGRVRLSSYFKWYRSDFGPDPIAFIRPYLADEQRRALDAVGDPKIEHLSYDWRLNDAGAPWAAR